MKKRKPLPAIAKELPRAAPVGRREWLLLIVALLVGVLARAIALSHSAVEHFDEGVYASNLYSPPPELAYPLQRFYAPPLLPALIEAGMIAGLPPNLAALLPGLLAGVGTIAALWWLGRSWFGPRVGLAAAALAAVDPFHVAYSTTALTDILLGLWLLLAVDAIARSLFAGDLRWAIVAGVYTGLAWWTKYNGWLPLAIGAAALPVLSLLLRPTWKRVQIWLACFAVTAVTALVVWSPYYFSLQPHGGYSAIAANHARYVVGISGWIDSASRHIASYRLMSGAWGDITGGLPALAALGGLGLMALLLRVRGNHPADERAVTGGALVAAWFGGLLVATPCYWPYPRLLVPWLLAAWLCVAIVLDAVWRDLLNPSDSPRARRWLLPGLTAGLLALAIGAGWQHRPAPELRVAARRDRLQFIAIATQLQVELDRVAPIPPETARDQPARAVYVLGEPALFFQLSAQGERLVLPAQSIPIEPVQISAGKLPTFLVTGPHANRDPTFQQQWSAAAGDWKPIGQFPLAQSPIVWLDLHDPRQVDALSIDGEVRAYQLQR